MLIVQCGERWHLMKDRLYSITASVSMAKLLMGREVNIGNEVNLTVGGRLAVKLSRYLLHNHSSSLKMTQLYPVQSDGMSDVRTTKLN